MNKKVIVIDESSLYLKYIKKIINDNHPDKIDVIQFKTINSFISHLDKNKDIIDNSMIISEYFTDNQTISTLLLYLKNNSISIPMIILTNILDLCVLRDLKDESGEYIKHIYSKPVYPKRYAFINMINESIDNYLFKSKEEAI